MVRRIFGGVMVLAIGASACVGPGPLVLGSDGAVPEIAPSAIGCGKPSYSCALPFPSDEWQIPDATTRTGYRLEVPANTVDTQVLDKLGPRDEMAEALVDSDGFSPLTPIVFQVPAALDDNALPADGGDVLAVWDATTGERVSIRVEVSHFLNDERNAQNIILAWPRTRFAYGHQVFASLRSGVRAIDGQLAGPAIGREKASRTTRDLAARLEPGISWDDHLSVTSFAIRSEDSIVEDTDRMAELVRSADHPIRRVEVNPSLIGGAAVVSGQLLATDFREGDGVIPRGGTATGADRWIEFMAVLPDRPATDAGAPVVIYGHGITVMKETMLVSAGQNAAKGYATIGIDLPNHGSRQNEGGHILDLAIPSRLGILDSLLLQGELDNISLLSAVKNHLTDLDVLPRNWFAGTGGDGVADLDTDHVYYVGTSLGGVLGTTFAALSPELDGSFLQVSGSGIIDVLFHSLTWEIFKSVIPSGAPYGETHILTVFAQQLLDRSDNTFYLDRIKQEGDPFFMVYAVNDGLVDNSSSERTIELLDLPMVNKEYGPIYQPLTVGSTKTMPSDGIGFTQVPTYGFRGNWAEPFLTHLAFGDFVSTKALDVWLNQRIAEIEAE